MITVVGSLNYDLTARAPRFPCPGESLVGSAFHTACGGKGANQAYAVARLGGAARMIGCVGRDTFGEAVLGSLRQVGVDTSHVLIRSHVPTGVAIILLDASGQNAIVVVPGANATLRAEDVYQVADVLRASDTVIAQLETTLEATHHAMAIARAAGKRTVLNPAPFTPIDDALLSLCDYVIPNEHEAAQLTGLPVHDPPTAHAAAQALRRRGAANVLITLGAQGVWLETPEWCGLVPAFSVAAADTTAAGDVFIGAFATRLGEGADPRTAARFACAAAAIAVTRPGAQPSVPTRHEVDAFLQAH
ncbi:MAG: ribokinase [Thermoflexales bacterium]